MCLFYANQWGCSDPLTHLCLTGELQSVPECCQHGPSLCTHMVTWAVFVENVKQGTQRNIKSLLLYKDVLLVGTILLSRRYSGMMTFSPWCQRQIGCYIHFIWHSIHEVTFFICWQHLGREMSHKVMFIQPLIMKSHSVYLIGVGGAVRFLVVGTIGKQERPPQGQLWMEQYLISLKYWPI